MKSTNQIWLTIGQLQAFISFLKSSMGGLISFRKQSTLMVKSLVCMDEQMCTLGKLFLGRLNM